MYQQQNEDKEKCGPITERDGKPGDKGHEKAKTFTSGFTGKICHQQLLASGTVWNKEAFSSVENVWVREHLNKIGIYQSVGPDEMNP